MFGRKSFTTAFAHIDCNAFFASVEQAYNPALKGKPVLVGGLGGGCVITASYEARKYGIKLGTPVFEARRTLPQAIIVPCNFGRYAIYHQKLLGIIGKYGPTIEAASIDECYLELKGLRRLHRKPYADICYDIKEDIKRSLGITVSIGVSVTKTLAKMGSNFKKPDAITVISGKDIENFLNQVKLSDVHGIGHNTHALLNKFGIHTALNFTNAPESQIQRLLGKVGYELQKELQGEAIYAVVTDPAPPKNLARTRSFKVTKDRDFIYHELMKNIELAFFELRRQQLKTQCVGLMLRTDNYKVHTYEIPIGEYINCPTAITYRIKEGYEKLFNPNLKYRSSGFITTKLQREAILPPTLFDSEIETSQTISLFEQIDRINHKYGHQTVALASASKVGKPKLQLTNLQTPFLGETI